MSKICTEIEKQLRRLRVVPVVALPSVEAGLILGEILVRCGLPVAEVTFRTPFAEEAMMAMKKQFPELLLLAGTVLSSQQVEKARNAGAECIVSPGFEKTLVEYCLAEEIMVCPGTATPSEVLQCHSMGIGTVKFFPAAVAGGIDMLKAMAAVFHEVRFMPTGGINLKNVAEYLKLDAVFCCGGSWLAPEKDMLSGNWQAIERNIRDLTQLLQGESASFS